MQIILTLFLYNHVGKTCRKIDLVCPDNLISKKKYFFLLQLILRQVHDGKLDWIKKFSVTLKKSKWQAVEYS